MGEVKYNGARVGFLGGRSCALEPPVAALARSERVCSSVANAPSHAEYPPHPRSSARLASMVRMPPAPDGKIYSATYSNVRTHQRMSPV